VKVVTNKTCMDATTRRCQPAHLSGTDEVNRRIQDGVMPLIRESDGCIGYALVAAW